MKQIPYDDACPVCERPSLRIDGESYCANKQCERYGEVVA